jgi:ubiquinone/menaquinone biosynthesis C-methylase UbiE
MTDSELHAQSSAAAAYEDLFVPALFGQWAPRVADAAQIGSGDRVLDVACGTGVLAREAAARVGPGGSVAGLDPNPGMLEVAARLAPGIAWREGTAESLPYPDKAFDAVVSQFGLMFFGDRRQAIREMLRVLAEGGVLAVAVWDSLDEIPGYAAEVELLERLAGEGAADAVRAPFALGDRTELEAMFEDAGATAADVSTLAGTARFPSIRTMVEADLRGWLPVVGIELPEERIAQILAEAEQALSSYRSEDGYVVFAAPAHIVTVTKTS